MSDAPSHAAADESNDATGVLQGSARGKAWFWLPVPFLVALDLWSKAAVFGLLGERFPDVQPQRRELAVDLLPEPFQFTLVDWVNTGTIWGLGKDFTGGLMIIRCAAVLLLLWFAWRTPAARKVQLVVFGLILAGALGNLYDNFFEPGGGVRDFLLFAYVDGGGVHHRFPAFNVADSCICVGAFSLAFLLWRQDRRDGKDAKGNAA